MLRFVLLIVVLSMGIMFIAGCHNGKLGFRRADRSWANPQIKTPSRAESVRRANKKLREAGVRNPTRYTKHQLNWAR